MYLKLKLATRFMAICAGIRVRAGEIAPAAFFVVVLACIAFASSASASTAKMLSESRGAQLLGSQLRDSDTTFEQLCLADNVERSEKALVGFVVAVPDSTTRFRLLRAYPELTFRVFSENEGDIGKPLTEMIASELVHVWWCNSEQALQHAQDGKPILQLSRPIASSVAISRESLNDYFYSNSDVISLRPQELEQLAAVGTMRIGLPDDSPPLFPGITKVDQ